MKTPGECDPIGPPEYPLVVRMLAVAHVLSLVVQPVGFVLLGAAAVVTFQLRHLVDGLVLGFAAGAVGCVTLCPLFRWWFVRWGRRHYPETLTADKDPCPRYEE